MDILTEVLSYVLDAVGVSALAAAVFNKDYNNKYVNGLMKVVNIVGANIWKAKNK